MEQKLLLWVWAPYRCAYACAVFMRVYNIDCICMFVYFNRERAFSYLFTKSKSNTDRMALNLSL